MRLIWSQKSQEEECKFLLIDVQNAFNKENQTEMLWAVCHDWPSGAQFTFNCYPHWATLVVSTLEYGLGDFLHIK